MSQEGRQYQSSREIFATYIPGYKPPARTTIKSTKAEAVQEGVEFANALIEALHESLESGGLTTKASNHDKSR